MPCSTCNWHGAMWTLQFMQPLNNHQSSDITFMFALIFLSTAVTIYTTSLTLNNSTFCPHSVFMCFVWIWEQTAIISLYNINWLVFITETDGVYCAVRTGSSYIILCSAHTVYLFLWISEQTAIISLYNINWLVFITETECVYCAVRTGCLNTIYANCRQSISHLYFHAQHILPQCISIEI